ncbi:MAG: flagellar filament capping protein FliD [Succinivibrio sp.]|nr:flagellar filament capping protein FliD [Succinivibrio sp.]
MVSITTSGAASGMDFESIIQAMISAKKTQVTRSVTQKKNNAIIEQSGLNTLKSTLNTFKSSLSSLTDDSSFNAHSVSYSSSAFSVTANSDASNMDFSLTVKQLASSEKISKTFSTSTTDESDSSTDESNTFNNAFQAGTITLSTGKKDSDGNLITESFEIGEGSTLEEVRTKINKNTLGISASLISTSDGYVLSLDGGKTGEDSTEISLSVSTDGDPEDGKDSLGLLAFSGETSAEEEGWNYTAGKNCVIEVDGHEIKSSTNTFDNNQVAGLTITAKTLSETETVTDAEGNETTGFKSTSVSVTQDTNTVASKVTNFVASYNAMMSSLSRLGARNTYTDGKSNEDGGDLAGDSMLNALQNKFSSMIANFDQTSGGLTIFDMGLELRRDGTLNLNSSDFKTALEENYTSVVELFSGDNGLITQLDDMINDYTKTAGIIDGRLDSVTTTLSNISYQEEKNESILEKYEASLRARYNAVDTLMANATSNLNYVTTALASFSNSSSSK